RHVPRRRVLGSPIRRPVLHRNSLLGPHIAARALELPVQTPARQGPDGPLYGAPPARLRCRAYHQPGRDPHAPIPALVHAVLRVPRLLPILRLPLPARRFHLALLDAVCASPAALPPVVLAGGEPPHPAPPGTILLHSVRI